MANDNTQITFPYANLTAAQQDGFKKVGGAEEFFKLAVHGYKQTIWRKASNHKRQEEDKAARAFYKAHVEKHGTAAERQLGRK